MPSLRAALSATLPSCAPMPALVIGVVTMRQLGMSTSTWSINIVATILGLLIWVFGRRLPPLTRQRARVGFATATIIAILLPFASGSTFGVYRWVAVVGLRLHASAIVAPLIIFCVGVAAPHRIRGAVVIAATAATILALQPDAAQAVSLAAACVVIFACTPRRQTRNLLLSIVSLCALAAASFIRNDPLPPVAHVEEIFSVVASRGPGWASIATVALLLLPAPFFVGWQRHRRPVTLALGVYTMMTILASAWGTFPVPVMGSGASPILGYFIALAAGLGGLSDIEEPTVRSSERSST